MLKQVVVNRQKEGEERSRGKDSLLERVTAAAEERQLSHNSLIAYRRTLAQNNRMGRRRQSVTFI